MAVHLDLLWESSTQLADSAFLLPVDLHFASTGLLVFDVGARRMRLVTLQPEPRVQTFGREGRGPGELTMTSWFQGSRQRPVSMDRTTRRLNRLEHITDSLSTSAMPNRSWLSSCALDDSVSLGAVVASDREFFGVGGATSDRPRQTAFAAYVGAVVVDSFAVPWPELRDVAPIGRQSVVRQLDDRSCVLLTSYQAQFAVTDTLGRFRAGIFVEPMPLVVPKLEMSANGRSGRVTLPDDARLGALDARAWRDLVIVLFEGRTEMRGRLIDAYRRSDLTYVGSLRLPVKASRIAVAGDTLAVIAERDDTPLIQLFRLTPRAP